MRCTIELQSHEYRVQDPNMNYTGRFCPINLHLGSHTLYDVMMYTPHQVSKQIKIAFGGSLNSIF